MPSGPADAKGLLLSAIRDPNPVVFFEPKALYRASVEDVRDLYYFVVDCCVSWRYVMVSVLMQVPVGDYTVPLGVAKTVLPGTDVTLVGWGGQVNVLRKVRHTSMSCINSRILSVSW